MAMLAVCGLDDGRRKAGGCRSIILPPVSVNDLRAVGQEER